MPLFPWNKRGNYLVEKSDSLSVKSLWQATDTPSKPFVSLVYVTQRSVKSMCFVEQTKFSILTKRFFNLMYISCIENLRNHAASNLCGQRIMRACVYASYHRYSCFSSLWGQSNYINRGLLASDFPLIPYKISTFRHLHFSPEEGNSKFLRNVCVPINLHGIATQKNNIVIRDWFSSLSRKK